MSALRSAPAGRVLWERAELARELARLREARPGLRVVLANGCFDLLHVGHARYLTAARAHGDLLVVALNDDAAVSALKGAGRPLVPLAERAELLASLRAVDGVTSFGERDLEVTLRTLRPDVHAKGTDYTPEDVPEAAVDRELNIEIAICGDAKSRSSSGLCVRAAAALSPRAPRDHAHEERPGEAGDGARTGAGDERR